MNLWRVVGVVLGLSLLAAPKARAQAPAALDDDAAIEGRLLESAKFLAADELQGRGIRTRGIDVAADYLRAEFARIGLKLDGYPGVPFQPFTFGAQHVLGEDNSLSVVGSDGERRLGLGDEYSLLMRCRNGAFDLPLVFAGYGITAAEHGYDDYAGLDVQGKGVLLLRHEPRQDDPESVFDGTKNSPHALLDSKVKNAVQHGAAAVVVCTDDLELRRRVAAAEGAESSRDAQDRLLAFNPGKGDASGVPVLHIRRAVAERLVRAGLRRELADVEREIDGRMRPASAELAGSTLRGTTTVVRQGRVLKNVIGVLEGEGPLREETIVVGAHYDHLGLGGSGSLAAWTVAVHNGADDNASGTAAMLEVARQLAARAPLRRRVLFIGFTAEESGLIGSEQYMRAPPVPLEQTVAMLNLDMVGRYRRGVEVSGTGTAVEFTRLVRDSAPRFGLQVALEPDGYGPSDHATFHERGVPVLHFFTGLHSDYHRPSDDYDKLNYEGMRRIVRMTTDIALQIANADRRPERRGGGDELGLADLGLDRDPAEGSPDAAPRPPRLGIRAGLNDDGEVRLATVLDRSPAQAAGLRTGDIVLRLDGKPVSAVPEFLAAIRGHQPGDKIRLRVRRGEIELEMEATLAR